MALGEGNIIAPPGTVDPSLGLLRITNPMTYFPKSVANGDQVLAEAVAGAAQILAKLPQAIQEGRLNQQKEKTNELVQKGKQNELDNQAKVGSMFDAAVAGKPGAL